MNNKLKIKKMVGIGVLLALVIILQLISNYVQFGPISITLALIPLTMGAIMYGPLVGLFLGMAMGAIILTAPSTGVFLSYNVWFTIIICLFKTGIAGLVSGYLYKGVIRIKPLGKANKPTAIVVASLITPVINTGLFIIGATFLFTNLYVSDGNFGEAFVTIYGLVLSVNFLVEFIVSAVLSPALVYLTKVLAKQNNLGFQPDFMLLANNEEDKPTYNEIKEENLFKE